jgi:hypothetical protein
MRATRVGAASVLVAGFLALVLARPADAQIFPPVDVHAALERVAHGGWHPMPTDPEWLAVKSALEWELAAAPRGELASEVRRAAVRIEVGVSPLVSHDPRTASFSVDTRPWISTTVPIPYFVELYASMDGGEWTLVAAADSGATCDARVVDVAWRAPVSLDFHHVRLLADLYHLARLAPGSTPRCGIRRKNTISKADAPAGPYVPTAPQDSMPLPTRDRSALSHERKSLPGLSFGLLDTGSARLRAGHGPAHAGVAGPGYSVFMTSLRWTRCPIWLGCLPTSGRARTSW